MADNITTSLTLKHDRVPGAPVAQSTTPPTPEERAAAFATNYDTSLLPALRRVDNKWADPVLDDQVFCLLTWVPAIGAKPDDKGFYGNVKIRGNFATQEAAAQYAKTLTEHDTYHKILTGYTGRPMPLVSDASKYIRERANPQLDEQLAKDVQGTMKEDLHAKIKDARAQADEMERRQKQLLEENKEDFEKDPIDVYITHQVRKANLVAMYTSVQATLAKQKESIIKTRAEIARMDEEYPEFKNQYLDKYFEECRKVGISEENEERKKIVKILAEDWDAELDF